MCTQVRAPCPAQIRAAQPPRNAGGRSGQIPDLSFSICLSGDLSCAPMCTCLNGPEPGRSPRFPWRHLALREEPIRSLRGSPSSPPTRAGVHSVPWPAGAGSAHGAAGGFARLARQMVRAG